MKDPYASDTLRHLADEMTGPMAQSALVQTRALAANGRFALDAPLREGGIFVALRRDLGGQVLEVRGRLQGAALDLPRLRFASWTQLGAALALHVPPADPATETIPAFEVRLRATLDGVALPLAQLSEWIDLRVTSGRLGKLFHVLQAETAVVRRHANAIAAARSLDNAEGVCLDRHGSDLGMPRFRNGLRLMDDGSVLTRLGREEDDDYRVRLALGREFSQPRPARYDARLSADGPLAELGPPVGLVVDEADNAFSVAVRLVSVDENAQAATRRRNRFMAFLRDWVLIDPTAGLPARRAMTQSAATSERALRTRLNAALDIQTPDSNLAPELARCLDRATALMQALGVAGQIRIHRVHEPDDGSRFDLGLGVEIQRPTDAVLGQLATAAAGGAPDNAPLAAIFSLLDPPANLAEDPVGAWFFHACGFATVERLSANRIYLSHTNVQSLVISGGGDAILAGGSATMDMSTRFTPQGGGAGSALMSTLLDAAGDALAGSSLVASPADFAMQGRDPNAAQSTRIRAAGLPVLTDWPKVSDRLRNLPVDGWALLELPAAQAQNLAAGQAAAWNNLGGIVRDLRDQGLAAAVPVITNAGVGLIVSVIGLPDVGTNLAGKAATGFRWFVVPLDRDANAAWEGANRRRRSGRHWVPKIKRPAGRETDIRFRKAGLYAVVVLGYERRGDTDPFEVRVRPEGEDDTLNFAQYEYVMNLMSLRAPAGVEINTWQLRQFHVASDSGTPVPLDPTASRTFRPYVQPRRAGAPPIIGPTAE